MIAPFAKSVTTIFRNYVSSKLAIGQHYRKSCKCGNCRDLNKDNTIAWSKILRYKEKVVKNLKMLFHK